MAELKHHLMLNREMSWIPCYLKSEADKVIAELEENHKKEVEQLLIETKRLENLCASYRHDCDNLAIREANALKEIGRDNRVIRHQKYKRYMAMAEKCKESLILMRLYEVTDEYWNLEPGQDAEYFCKKGDFYSTWRKRWLKLADKFNEA